MVEVVVENNVDAIQLEQLRRARRERLVGVVATCETLADSHEFTTPGFDPIGSARRYQQRPSDENFAAVKADAETALLEAMATREVELYPSYEAQWNGSEFMTGEQTLEGVATNGLRGDQRTHSEFLEAVTPAELVKLGLDQRYAMLTVSIQDEPGHAELTMLRYTEIERSDDGISLRTQQMSLPNYTHSEQLITDFYAAYGSTYDPDRDSVEQTILVERDGAADQGVLGFGEQLEDLSERADMFYQKADYSALEAQATQRRALVAAAADELAVATVELAADDTHPVVAALELDDRQDDEGQVQLGLRSRILLKHLENQPDVAERVFGEATANNLRQAQTETDVTTKKQFISLAINNAEETKVCSVGSCGIVASSPDARQKLQSMGYSGEFVTYPDSKCGSCGKTGDVHFAVSRGENTACCLSCMRTKKI